MMQLGDNRMWQLYPMGSLPVLWCINSDLDAGTVSISSEKWLRLAQETKKSGIKRERRLETLANYTRVKNVVIHIGE